MNVDYDEKCFDSGLALFINCKKYTFVLVHFLFKRLCPSLILPFAQHFPYVPTSMALLVVRMVSIVYLLCVILVACYPSLHDIHDINKFRH